MGAPMAANLVKKGFAVTGYNRSKPAVDRLVERGGRAAQSIADTVTGADVVITMLPDSPDVEAVALGPGGVFEYAPAGCVYIDMSTIRPDVARAVAEGGAVRGVRCLDAPVSGGEAGAIEAALSIMVGGSGQDFADSRAVLDAMGSTVVHVGGNGTGQLVKAANQLMVAGIIELLSEAIVLLEAHEVDATAALQVIGGGLAANRVLDRKSASMLARQFKPGFRVDLHHKDLGIVLDTARAAGVVLPVGAVVAQLMAALKAQGSGNLDHSALLTVVDQLSGRT
jgi:2-hydroxy-3-oxopropionate reductase